MYSSIGMVDSKSSAITYSVSMYISASKKGTDTWYTSLESLKYEYMTLFYKKCQINWYQSSYSPENVPNFDFWIKKFACFCLYLLF